MEWIIEGLDIKGSAAIDPAGGRGLYRPRFKDAFQCFHGRSFPDSITDSIFERQSRLMKIAKRFYEQSNPFSFNRLHHTCQYQLGPVLSHSNPLTKSTGSYRGCFVFGILLETR